MKNAFKVLDLADITLKKTRVDIWQYPLHTEFMDAHTLLNEEELARANRFHFAHHRRRFTVARAMLRLILARYLQSPPTKITFSYGHHGKPEIQSPSLIQFNLSHSGELALLAIGQQYPVGIDLEFFSARPYEGIGAHLFSPSEIQGLDKANSMLKPLIFFHIWAQKEAFIKACGLGLSYPTEQFDVAILPQENQQVVDALHNSVWNMISFMPQVACSAALCCHPDVKEVRYLRLAEAKVC